MIQIRHAILSDLDGILSIINDEIIQGTALWMTQPHSYPEQLQWFEHHKREKFPILVATDEAQKVLGFASYDYFRAYDGYQHTMEHSVYLIPKAQGKGLGQQLMKRLISYAKQHDVHVMIAAITADNHASIRLHEKLDFKMSGILPQTGIKFDQRLDLLFMYKILTPETNLQR